MTKATGQRKGSRRSTVCKTGGGRELLVRNRQPQSSSSQPGGTKLTAEFTRPASRRNVLSRADNPMSFNPFLWV